MGTAKLTKLPDRLATIPETESEFLDWCANDPRFFHETCCSIKLETGQLAPFRYNIVQSAHYHSIFWYPRPHFAVRRVFNTVQLKSRQFGGSTLEIGILDHSYDFWRGFSGKVVTFKEKTASKLKEISDVMIASAHGTFRSLGLDAERYLPLPDRDNVHEHQNQLTGSVVEFLSQGGKGTARSLTTNAIYGTEVAYWDRYDEAMSGLSGSFSKSGLEWMALDSQGNGRGNRFYQIFSEAVDACGGVNPMELSPGYRGFVPYFYGREHFPYPPGFLETQIQRLGSRLYRQEYPRNHEEGFLTSTNSRFDEEHITRCARREMRFLEDIMTDEEIRAKCVPVHGGDTSEGGAKSDYAVLKTRDALTGLEICPPIRVRATPHQFAHQVAERHTRFPGLLCIERNNTGHAVIVVLDSLGLSNWLYRHQDHPDKDLDDCKAGFPTMGGLYGGTKALMEARYEAALETEAINLPSENGRKEVLDYCNRPDGSTGAPTGTKDDDEGRGRFYDDEAIADMLCVFAMPQGLMRFEAERSTMGVGVYKSPWGTR